MIACAACSAISAREVLGSNQSLSVSIQSTGIEKTTTEGIPISSFGNFSFNSTNQSVLLYLATTVDNTAEQNRHGALQKITDSICDWRLSIAANRETLLVNDSLHYQFFVQRLDLSMPVDESDAASEFVIEYGVRFENGTEIVSSRNKTNVNAEVFQPVPVANGTMIVIAAKVIPACIDNNQSNNEENLSVLVLPTPREATILDDAQSTTTNESSPAKSTLKTSLESRIVVLNASLVAVSGAPVTIGIELFRGSTRKRTVSAWAESEKSKVSTVAKTVVDEQQTIKNATLVIFMKQECFKEGARGILRITGLDQDQSMPLTLENQDDACSNMHGKREIHEKKERPKPLLQDRVKPPTLLQHKKPVPSLEKKTPPTQNISYLILSKPQEVEQNKSFQVRAQVRNPTQQDVEMTVWAKVLSSSRVHSRAQYEPENVSLMVLSGANVTVDLSLIATGSARNQTIRVFFLRNDRKTPVVISVPLQVFSPLKQTEKNIRPKQSRGSAFQQRNALRLDNNASGFDKQGTNRAVTVYESSAAKSRRMIVYFLFAVFLLLFGMVSFKRIG